jgi:serine O-acetyltransferase
MIQSKQDYLDYLKADRAGKSSPGFSEQMASLMFPANIAHFKRLLRKAEYYKNVKKGWFNSVIYLFVKYKFKKISLKLGFSIPENVFGTGLTLPHYGTIVVHPRASIGANCRIHVCTNIGESGGVAGPPVIGDNVYIGPGAKIYGNITITSNIAIAANAAVGKSFLNEHKMIGGVPAKEIGDIDIKQIIKHIK